MKKLAIALVLIATSCFAGGLEIVDRIPVQGAAPNGFLSRLLTVNSTTIDLSKNIWWGLYAPSTGCKYRIMPTSAKGSYPQFTAIDGTITSRVRNSATKFVNFSGCTLAELEIQ